MSDLPTPRTAEDFESHRSYLFGIAYRMLGSVVDAEDILQDAYLRWQATNLNEVQSVKSYLTTIVTRLCIDQLRSVQSQREQYIGPWIPEPLLMDNPSRIDPVELSDSLSIAFLMLLEKLSPVERAVFLMRDVFSFDYPEIAQVVDKSEANVRQILSRAKQHLASDQPRFNVKPEQQQEVFGQFILACQSGDLDQLLGLLAEDAVMYSDGGGKVVAATRPISGADPVGRFLLGIIKKAPPGTTFQPTLVNGNPGVVIKRDERVESILTLRVDEGLVRDIFAVRNPDKLTRFQPHT